MISLHLGDARSVLAGMPAESVHCVVTSPPFWGLRRYQGAQDVDWESGWHGAFGAEPAPELYLSHSLEVLRAIRRVLRADGTVWLNLGDTRYSGGGRKNDKHGKMLSGLKGHDYPSYSLCDGCVMNPPPHMLGSENRLVSKSHALTEMSSHLYKEEETAHADNSDSFCQDGKSASGIRDSYIALKPVGGEVHGVQESTNSAFFGGLPEYPFAQACYDFLTSILPSVAAVAPSVDRKVCPFLRHLALPDIQGLSELNDSKPGIGEIDETLVARILDKVYASPPYSTTKPRQLQGGVLKPTELCLIPQRLAVMAQEDGWFVKSDIIWAKGSVMPESVQGTRWERCRVKVKAQERGTSPQRIGAVQGTENEPQRNAPGGKWQGGAEYADCPGCPRCSANDGYVLRRGSGRPTDSYEHILLLHKSPHYFYDSDGYREPQSALTLEVASHYKIPIRRNSKNSKAVEGGLRAVDRAFILPNGRNARSVWRMNHGGGYDGPHFATYPEELPRRAILLGTSAKGCCPKCGAPWARVLKITRIGKAKQSASMAAQDVPGNPMYRGGHHNDGLGPTVTSETLGWRATCSHPHTEAETVPAVVLDCFMGTGTTLAVALALGRRGIGIEIAESYLALARQRLESTTMGMRI